jgi:hypothetical protein
MREQDQNADPAGGALDASQGDDNKRRPSPASDETVRFGTNRSIAVAGRTA